MDNVTPVIAWLAPIVSTLIITWLTALINRRMDESKKDQEREETERKTWRSGVDKKLKDQDEKIDSLMLGQTTQMRADITHKIHRYMDDLGCASTEEKNSLNSEYEVYCQICEKYGIKNDFVAHMMEQVMELPSRPQGKGGQP